MESIVAELVERIKGKETFLEKEQAMSSFFSNLNKKIAHRAFCKLDDELTDEWKERGFKIDRKSDRKVTFLFGEVDLKRRRMKNEAGEIRYPLDEFLGIRKGVRYSSLVLRNVSELGSMMVYRHVEKAIDCLTSWSMSHQKVQTLMVKTGEIIKARATHEARYDALIEKKKVPYLYIEGDGVMIKGQKKKKLEIHRFQICEGSRKIGKRTELIHPHFVSSMRRRTAQKELTLYLQETYDLTDTIVISNSDGGSGYEPEVFEEICLGCKKHEHFRDIYHVQRKIKERLNFVPQLQSKMMAAIYSYDRKKVQAVLDTAESLIDANEELCMENLRLLAGYIDRNWMFLKPMKQRELHDPQACLGAVETTHRKMTYRMKRQGRLWTEKGANAIIRVIDSLRNDELDDWLNQYCELPNEEIENQKKCEKMRRLALKKPKFIAHEGAYQGQIASGYAKSSPLGQLSKGLSQLNTTPSYL